MFVSCLFITKKIYMYILKCTLKPPSPSQILTIIYWWLYELIYKKRVIQINEIFNYVMCKYLKKYHILCTLQIYTLFIHIFLNFIYIHRINGNLNIFFFYLYSNIVLFFYYFVYSNFTSRYCIILICLQKKKNENHVILSLLY